MKKHLRLTSRGWFLVWSYLDGCAIPGVKPLVRTVHVGPFASADAAMAA